MKIKKKYYFILLFYSLAQSQNIEDSRQNAITNAIKNASPGVASINVTQIKRYMNPFSFYDQLRSFETSGSGVIISPDGYLLSLIHI